MRDWKPLAKPIFDHVIGLAVDVGEVEEHPSELLAKVRDAIKRGWAKCPLCQGSIRQTVGLTCELCGRDYSKEGDWR
jgi:hypothetical protein